MGEHKHSSSGSKRKAGPLSLILVFILLCMAVIAGSAFYYLQYDKTFRERAEAQLTAIAELKVNQLVEWRKERLVGASLFYRNSSFSGLVKRYINNPGDNGAQEQLLAWLGRFKAIPYYDRVFLFDARGNERLSLPGNSEPTAAHIAKDIAAVLHSGNINFLDFHRDAPDRPIHLTLMVPLFDGSDGARPLGVLVVRINPYVYLFPFIQKWPIPGNTSETLLARREGNAAVFLNELKFRKNTALRLTIPLERTETPVIRAVLGGNGVMEGIDYRGIKVLAALRSVPGSPWFLVAKTDITEIYGPLRERFRQIVMFLCVILVGMGVCLFLLLRQQRMQHYREQLKAAEALRESERKLSEAQKMAQLGHWDWDIKTGKVVWSDEVYKIFQLDPKNFTPLIDSILELSPWPEDHERDKELIGKAMASHEKGSFEQRFLRPDKSIGYYDSTFQGKYDDRGNLVSIVGTVQDVTGRKNLENKLHQYNARLEQKSRDLEQLIYVTSHDLRTPLVNVQGFAKELTRSVIGLIEAIRTGDVLPEAMQKIDPILQKDIPESLEYIQSGITRMDMQLSALLKLSRLGRMAANAEKLDMSKVVTEVVNTLEYMTKEKGAEIRVEELPPCTADAAHTNQIFLNLIVNALKYLEVKRPGVIRVSGNRQGNEVVYCVEDNGVGIAPEYLEKIFELFYRVERGTVPGEGLGLTIVRQGVEKQNGVVWVESEPGKGSRFFVKLPGV